MTAGKLPTLDRTLSRLEELIRAGRFEELETDTLEIKSVPADAGAWRERHKSACAFLNTRGGLILLGIKEEGTGSERRYIFTGWQPQAEPKLKEFGRQFTEKDGRPLDLSELFPPPAILDFMDGKIAVLLVSELSADRKFVFFQGESYKRLITGDHRISGTEIERQQAFREEALHARELQPVPRLTLADIDLDKLNSFIFHLNQPVPIETMKPDLEKALPFLERRSFIKDGSVTVLGALVCAKHPGDYLGFRSQVHGYVDVPNQIAQDKQDFVENVLPLMEQALGYLMRNIQVGITPEAGGTGRPEYPESVLRETVNNALAHRDYAIDRQVIVAVKPSEHVSISNPGSFRRHLLIEHPNDPIPLRRILPEAKPRNPKLADILRVYRKWEGRGIGMATLVNLCLQDQIGLPYYRLASEEVTLHLCPGPLLDDRMERLFDAYSDLIEKRMQGNPLSNDQKRILSYLIKSEWANEKIHYTILLTPDNNHFNELLSLESAGLIFKHEASTPTHPIYVAHRELVRKTYLPELRAEYGDGFDALDLFLKEVLGAVYRFDYFSKSQVVSARQVTFYLWHERGGTAGDIKSFDTFNRRVRSTFNKLEKSGFLIKNPGTKLETRGYRLNRDFRNQQLL